MQFTFNLPTKIYFGEHLTENFIKEIMAEGYQKVGIVIDHNLLEHPVANEIISQLKKNMAIVSHSMTIAEPTYRFLEEYRGNFMHTGIEAVIGIGGGSALDVAKAMAVLVTNLKPALEYRGFDKMTEPVLPIYTMPTTAGTGSEITPNASFVDDIAKKKLGINGEAIRPKCAFLHPGLVITCPREPAIAAALDALVHSVEALAARKCTAVAAMFAREAIQLILNNILKAVLEKDREGVEQLFWGSLLAGLAMSHSGTGPAAALSYPLGVHKKVPHGLAGGIFLPMIMRWNIEQGYFGYGGLLSGEGSLLEKAGSVLKMFEEIWEELNVPKNLHNFNFTIDDLPLFLEDLKQLRGAIDQNPIPIGEDTLEMWLRSLA